MTPNSSGLFLHVGDEAISVRHISGEVIAEWNLLRLAKRFQQKIPALILVSARVELRADVEYFHYYRAKLLAGTDTSLLANQFRLGRILLDIRMHDAGTRARNHGTGFRAYEADLSNLFATTRDL